MLRRIVIAPYERGLYIRNRSVERILAPGVYWIADPRVSVSVQDTRLAEVNDPLVDNLVDEYPPAVPGMLNVGLLHTSLDGLEGHSRYAPCTVNQLRSRGYQYWALGHIHQHLVFPDQRQPLDPWIVFPGCR